jgi:hypothetical protein
LGSISTSGSRPLDLDLWISTSGTRLSELMICTFPRGSPRNGWGHAGDMVAGAAQPSVRNAIGAQAVREVDNEGRVEGVVTTPEEEIEAHGRTGRVSLLILSEHVGRHVTGQLLRW